MRRSGIIISVCFLLVITVVAFYPSLDNGFTNWDDPAYVVENAKIKDLSWRSIKKIFSSPHYGGYEPLTEFSFAVEYRFFGLNPRPYHTTNLLLHLFNCLLVFWLVFLLSRRVEVSFIAALLFGVHPLHVESVAWVSERKDVLYAFFFFGSLIAYLYYCRKNAVGYYYLSLSLFFVSLLPKPQGLLLPLVLFLLDYFRGRKIDRRSLFEKAPFFVLAVLFAVIGLAGQFSVGQVKKDTLIAVIPNISNAGCGMVFYLVKLGLPVNLSCFCPYLRGLLQTWLTPFIPAALIAGVVLSARYGKKIIFGSLFFLINIVLVLQVVCTGPAMVADRYTYISSVGLFYVAGAALAWLYDRIRQAKIARTLFLAAVVLIIGQLSLLTWLRCEVWRDSESLWSDVLRKYPDAQLARNNLGNDFLSRDKFAEAVFHYTEALRIKPDYADAHNNLASALFKQGDLEKAVFHYTEALRIKPDCAEAQNNLGLALVRQGKLGEGVSHFTEALRLRPEYVEAHDNLGVALAEQGKLDEAVLHFTESLRINPGYAKAHHDLGVVLAEQGKLAESIMRFTEALRINPDFTDAWRKKELILKRIKQGE